MDAIEERRELSFVFVAHNDLIGQSKRVECGFVVKDALIGCCLVDEVVMLAHVISTLEPFFGRIDEQLPAELRVCVNRSQTPRAYDD